MESAKRLRMSRLISSGRERKKIPDLKVMQSLDSLSWLDGKTFEFLMLLEWCSKPAGWLDAHRKLRMHNLYLYLYLYLCLYLYLYLVNVAEDRVAGCGA